MKTPLSILGLCLLVSSAALLSPLPVAAQEEAEIAVSNIDRGHTNTERRTVPLAQGFTTGRRLGGYAVDAVEIRYDDMEGDAFSAGIYSVVGDYPTAEEVIPLSPTESFSRGKMVFTPSGSNSRLDENTDYAVRVVSDSDRDVDYLATLRGHKLDCPVSDLNCTSMNDGWTIRNQLLIGSETDTSWEETEYFSPSGVRLNVALSIRIKTLKVPNPPRWLTVLNEIGTVRLGWRAPITSGARPVTAYRHRQRINVDPPAWSDWVESKEDLYHYTITGLTTGTEYAFQVQAGNDGGWSKASKVRTTISEPLGPPTLTATANADGSIGLTWTHDDAPIPRGYEVRWKRNTHGWDGNPGGDEQMHYCFVTASNYTITGGIGNLENSACLRSGAALKTDGTVYDIEVRTAVIKGAPDYYFIYSSPATASVTPIRTAPTAPRTLAAAAGEKHVTLRWTEPATVGSYPVIDYEYRYKETARTAWSEWRGTVPTTEWCSDCDTWIGRVNYWQRNSSASDVSHAVVGLADGTSYDFEMRAVNELSNSSEPSSVSATPVYGRFTEIEQTPDACHVIPDPASEWDVTCYWVAGAWQRSYADMKLLGYEVEGVERDPDTGEISYELNTGDIPSMARHKDGGWEVARVSPSGRSAPQNVVRTSGMPGLLQASAVGSRIDLAWLTTYPPSTSYEAEWSANGKTDWQAVDPPDEDSDTIYSHSGLTGSTVYYYRVRGVNEHGSGPWSPIAYAETGAQRRPTSAPTDLVANAVSATTINLSWTAPSDDVNGYEVEWSAENGNSGWQVVEPEHGGLVTEYSHTDLTTGTNYFYRVRAFNVAGGGPWSELASATTDALPALTASFEDVPESHDGESAFTFELRFSEELPVGYRTLRDHAFMVSGGMVKNAGRLEPGSNMGWRIEVRPNENGDVTIILPATGDCDDDGAICTEDGRKLSSRLELSVSGPESQQQQAVQNSPATGAPIISGMARVGETLTADTSDVSDADGSTNASFAFQWVSNDGSADAEIQDATASTYALVDADEGKTIKVQVTFTDDVGNEESLTSAATAAVEASPNTPATGAPAITGTAQVGETLTADLSGIADDDGLDKTSFSYQWQADGADIPGATSDTHTLAEADEGKAVSVTVSFTDDAGHSETLTSAATAAVEAAAEEASEEPTDRPHGLTAEASEGAVLLTWNAPVVDYHVSSYHILRHRPEQGEAEPLVYVDQTPNKDTAYTDTEVEPGVLYVYRVKAIVNWLGDLGEASDAAEIRMQGTSQQQTANNPATGAPTITGTAQVGETLTADTSVITDEDGLDNAVFSYQWLADGADISGATDATYALAAADEGKAISVTVTFTDDRSHGEELTSATTDPVEAKPNTPATGAPTISGTAQVGETLTADVSGILDEDGLTNAVFSYQWVVNEESDDSTGASYTVVVADDGSTTWVPNDGTIDTDIEGATGPTYTLTEADEGRSIRVRVSFTDDAGNSETVTSAPTLMAGIRAAPASHDGENVFTFELRFSEEFGISYKTLRDHAFTVTGGTVRKAQRLEQGSNIGWRITVRPNSDGQVTITLPITEDCDAQGAICTDDGRKLSHRLELTVSGP